MSSGDVGALGLLEELLGAVGDGAAWLRFLDALQRAISPDCLTFFAADARRDRPGFIAGPSLGVVAANFDDLLGDIRRPAAGELAVGSVQDVPEASGFYQTRFFEEVLAPAGAVPGTGLVVVTEHNAKPMRSATLVLPRKAGWAPRPADRALLETLAPHMVVARRLHLQLTDRQREEEALVSAFDRLLLGVVFLDEGGRISYANRSASELIGHAAGFASPNAVLDDHTRAWRELLTTNAPGALVQAPDDGRPVQVLDAPLEWSERDQLAASRFARAFFIADPKQSSGDLIQVLRELFGLTESETRLTALLLADTPLQDAARRLGITESTARGVLKSIFAKTGTNRQAELLRLLLRGPMGQLRTRDGMDARPEPEATGRTGRRPQPRARG